MRIIQKLRLYLETTVFNYYFAEDRPGHEDVLILFEAIRARKYEAYTSSYVMQELEQATEPKKNNINILIIAAIVTETYFAIETFRQPQEETTKHEIICPVKKGKLLATLDDGDFQTQFITIRKTKQMLPV